MIPVKMGIRILDTKDILEFADCVDLSDISEVIIKWVEEGELR